eukprot:SAG11_NODE_2228_length_3654_cov_1.962640_5_plen_80_part_00
MDGTARVPRPPASRAVSATKDSPTSSKRTAPSSQMPSLHEQKEASSIYTYDLYVKRMSGPLREMRRRCARGACTYIEGQ